MAGTILQGKDLVFYVTVNGISCLFAHAEDWKITTNATFQETTTKNTLKGMTYDYTGKYSWKLNASGITNFIDSVNIVTFQNAIQQSNKLPFIATDSNNVEWSGTVLIGQTDTDSPFNNISKSTIDMQGDGELTIIEYSTPPLPGVSYVLIKDQLDTLLATVAAPGTYNVLRFNNIDCGHAVQNNPLIIMQAN